MLNQTHMPRLRTLPSPFVTGSGTTAKPNRGRVWLALNLSRLDLGTLVSLIVAGFGIGQTQCARGLTHY
jgi:hypothetical protein